MVRKGIVAGLILGLLMWASPAFAQTPAPLVHPAIGQLEWHINKQIRDILPNIPEWISICTITQILPGEAVSAAHCINRDHVLIFARKDGSKYIVKTERTDGVPVVDGYRIGFYVGDVLHLEYIPATPVFDGFSLLLEDPLFDTDISVFKYQPAWIYSLPPAFNTDPKPGEVVCSTGFSAGIRQWSGCATFRGFYVVSGYPRDQDNFLMGVIPESNHVWAPGASGSLILDMQGRIVGVLVADDPDFGITIFVPAATLQQVLDRVATQ